MNWAEKAMLNNPARRAVQRHYEAPLLKRLGADLTGANVLEIGCGEGAGAQVLLEKCGATRVRGFDIDPAQITRARRRLRDMQDRVEVAVGDATALPAADGSVDAVVDFGIVHHVPAWRDAVAEAARVLRPGGQLIFEEVTAHALAGRGRRGRPGASARRSAHLRRGDRARTGAALIPAVVRPPERRPVHRPGVRRRARTSRATGRRTLRPGSLTTSSSASPKRADRKELMASALARTSLSAGRCRACDEHAEMSPNQPL
jgi:SAM-dependent methyltransferase